MTVSFQLDMTRMQAELFQMIRKSIAEAIPPKKVGVAFSGGVDSALLSKMCHEMGYDVTLLTTGFSESHDILFAKKVNELLQLPHHTLEIDPSKFAGIAERIRPLVRTSNLSWHENCIAFYYVSELARGMGVSTVVTANGIDELFCGYDAYRRLFSKGGSQIRDVMDAKLENELAMMKAVNRVSSEFGVSIVQPLLNQSFIEYAKTIPISEKIRGSDDFVRKHVIRRLASIVGVPELSYTKRKKALQYGTRIHNALLKAR